MRSQPQRRLPSFLLALALLATVAELYAVRVHYQRELSRIEADAMAQASATANSLTAQMALEAVAIPTPVPQTPQEGLSLALSGLVDLMRAPRAGQPAALQRHAEAALVEAFQREIEHLRVNNLRLSRRSGYELLRVEQLTAERHDQARLLTEERWVYEEETTSGQVVRCLVEVSSQRYDLEHRGDRWVVVKMTLADAPQRTPCTDAPEATASTEPRQ